MHFIGRGPISIFPEVEFVFFTGILFSAERICSIKIELNVFRFPLAVEIVGHAENDFRTGTVKMSVQR